MNRLIEWYKKIPVQVRASSWFLVCTILQRSITIITTPIYTRMLPTDGYGVYSTYTSWMTIITCFVSLNLYQGVYQQAIVKFKERKEGYSASLQLLTFILSFLWFLIYIGTRSFWNDLFSLSSIQMICMFITIWMTAVFGYWSSDQRVDYKYRLLVFVTLIEAVIQPVLSIVLLKVFELGVDGIVIGQAISVTVVYVFLFVLQVVKGINDIRIKDWLYSLKLGIPLIPHYVSSVVLNSSDRIMIQKLIGDSEAGIYNLAYTVSMCGTLINQAVLQTLNPWLYSRIREKQFEEIKKIAYPAMAGIAVVNIVVIIFTPELISIFAPDSYGSAIWVMPPVAMSVFFMFTYNLFAAFEFYYEKTYYVSIATAVGAGLNIVLNYVFINMFGYYAAGYTTLICYIVFCIAHYIFMKKICKEEISNIKVFDIKVLIGLSIVFVMISFSIMFTYKMVAIRYMLALIMVVVLFVYRQRIMRIITKVKKEK